MYVEVYRLDVQASKVRLAKSRHITLCERNHTITDVCRTGIFFVFRQNDRVVSDVRRARLKQASTRSRTRWRIG